MLNGDILENINTLLAITSSINETYVKLKQLEIVGQKDSTEYKSTIESLKSSLDLEKSIYDRFPKDLDVLSQIEHKINGNKDYWLKFNLQENINAILNYENLIKLRIQLNLFSRMLAIKDADFVINVNDESVLENQTPRNILIINTSVIKDFLNTTLVILNDYLNNPEYELIKDQLLNFKYNLSFVYEEIENDLLENNFNISNELYWEANAISDYYQLDRLKLNAIQKGTVYSIFRDKIRNIINIDNTLKSDKPKMFTYIISEIFTRVSLLFIGEETVNYFKTLELQLAEGVSHDEMAIEKLKKAQNRVNGIFDMYEKDRELLNVISLRVL